MFCFHVGTGKTRVIVSMISQLLYGKELESRLKRVLKILVLATSNAAVDIITRRLLYAQERTEITNGKIFYNCNLPSSFQITFNIFTIR